jgi:hypothetical protein
MKTRRRFITMLAMGAASAAFAAAPPADAQGNSPPQAEVLVIHATQCKEPSVDPAIGEMPPLKFNCYKLVEKKTMPLTKGNSSHTSLPNGRTFQLSLNEQTPDKKYKVSASISQPDGKGYMKLADITAEPNKRFNVGGWSYKDGALVLAIKIIP